MNKRYKSNQFKKVPYLLALVIVLLSVGYSAFGTDMNLSNIVAKIRLKKDVRISSVIVSSTEVDASSSYQEYNVNRLIAGITLPEADSTITFGVGIVNLGNVEAGILKINNLPENLDYEFIDYNLKDKICDKEDSTKCSLGATSEIKLKIKYKGESNYDISNTSFSLDLELDIEPFHTVSYTNITNNGYPTEVLGGNSLTVNFGDTEFNYLKVLIDDVVTYNYTFKDGVLTISNVTGNVEIMDEAPMYLANLKIEGNSVQEGKNLFDINDVAAATAKYTINNNTISVLSDGNGTYRQVRYNKIAIQPSTSYYVSFQSELVGTGKARISIYYYDANNTYISETTCYSSKAITPPDNTKYIEVRIYASEGSTIPIDDGVIYSNIQIEKGYAATTYEPYREPTPDTPMEILSVGEKTKNLVNIPTTAVTTSNKTINVDLPTGKVYTAFAKIDSNGITGRIRFVYTLNDTNVYSNSANWVSNGISVESGFEIPEGATNIRILLQRNTNFDGVFSEIMVVEGTYTSSDLPEYEPYNKYKVPIEISSKNVYSGGDMNFTKSYSLSLSNPIKAGTYTISALFDNNSDIYDYGLLFYGTQTTIFGNLRYDKNQRTSKTVTFTEDITRLVFYATKSAATNEGVTASFTNIQIEEGTNATSYEPYMEPKTYNIFINEPLRKVGDVSDYIDFETGQVVRNTTKYTFDDTEGVTISRTGDINQSYYIYSPTLSAINIKTGEPLFSDILSYQNNVQNVDTIQEVYLIGYGGNTSLLYIQLPLELAPTHDEVKTLLNGKTIYGVALTPTEESIEVPTDIKFNGYSVVKVNTEIKPSNITWTVE